MSSKTTRLRKYLYLITDHPDDDIVGNVEFADKPRPTAEKNSARESQHRNVFSGETWTETVVGLGYEDFDDEADYDARAAEVANEKLAEIDDRHLEAAGLEPAEYGSENDD